MDYQYHFESDMLHGSRCFAYDELTRPVAITDFLPHLVWTDTHQFVILQIQTDGSLYIFTNDNSVTKIPSHVHSDPDFDFRECISEEHGVSTFAKPNKFARCLTIDEQDPAFAAALNYGKQSRSVTGELYDSTYLALTNKPIKTIHRRSLKDDSETNPERHFTFRNFDEPNKEFYDCWYHPSNQWKTAAIEMFMCYKTTADIIVVNDDTAFPPSGVMIRPPLAHQCGINSALVDNSVSRFLFKCPSSFLLGSNPESPTIKCKVKFTYFTSPISHLIDQEELDSLMTDIIISYARAWNISQYRCRFEFDNQISSFWTTQPITERMIEVLKNPVCNVNSLYITNQFRASQNFRTIKTFVPDTRTLDQGRFLISTVITTKPTDFDHFDISTIPNLVFSFVDDMDARDRGFTWFHRHHSYIIYKNIKEPNLFALGNLKTNVFIDFTFCDGQVLRAWRRFEPVVRLHLISTDADLRPIVRQEHPDTAKRFTFPGTDTIAHPGEQNPFRKSFHQIEWTPVIIACGSKCNPPKTLNQFCFGHPNHKQHSIKGVRRSITIRNDFFNGLIKHEIFAICTATFSHRWKVCKYGPISFLICGSQLDENNVIDFNHLALQPPGSCNLLSLTFHTFSPTFGLCGFTSNMVNQFTDAPPVLQDEFDLKFSSLPQWPCSHGCRVPETIARLNIIDGPEFRQWLSELALNVYKLKYLHSESTSFKCSINRHAEWRVYTRGTFQTFFCDNFALFGLNFRLPIIHPKRWAMAYCFTEEELRSLPWNKTGKFWTATLTNAIITRQRKQFPMYSVYWIPSGDFCVFHLGRLGMAQPVLDSLLPHKVVYSNRFEADRQTMDTLLRGSKMDTITSNTLETMVCKVFQSNKALEYELLKFTLQLKGNKEPNPEQPEWKSIQDKFASSLELDPTLTPQDSQSRDGVEKTVDQSQDIEYCMTFDLSLSDESFDTSSQNTSSTL